MVKENIDNDLHQKLDSIIEAMTENASDMGVTLFMPHVADAGYKKTSNAAKWFSLVSRARNIIQIQPEMMEILNYKLENPIDPDVMEEIYGKDILAVLWSVDQVATITEVLQDFVKNISESMPIEEIDENGNRISGAFQPPILESLVLYLDNNDDGDDDNAQQNSSTIHLKSNKSQEIEIISMDRKNANDVKRSSKGSNANSLNDTNTDDGDDGRPKLTISPMWTPSNQSGNSIFMFTFFRNVKKN